MTRKEPKLLQAGTVMVAALLSACATQPMPASFDNRTFSSGATRLLCSSLLCASKWRLASRDTFERYAAGDWAALVRTVEELQYDSDIAYFYLGRAADELGEAEAAATYFRLARAASTTCATDLLGDCNGIDVAEEVKEQLSEIESFDVTRAQNILASLGLYTISIDGIIGPRTVAALEQFQSNLGLEKTGALNSETRRALLTVEGVVESNRMATRSPRAEQTVIRADQAPRRRQGPKEQPARGARTAAPAPSVASSARSPRHQGAVDSAEVTAEASAARRDESERSRVTLDVELLSEADPFAPVVAVVPRGEWVEVLNRGAEWAKISHDQATGYVYSDLLQ